MEDDAYAGGGVRVIVRWEGKSDCVGVLVGIVGWRFLFLVPFNFLFYVGWFDGVWLCSCLVEG